MTASTLYEAVEPQLLWKHVLNAVFNEVTSGDTRYEVGQTIYVRIKWSN